MTARGDAGEQTGAATRPATALVLGAALAGPAGAGVGVLALLVALRGELLTIVQGCGPWFWAVVAATGLAAVATGVLGWAAARGSRLPSALALGAATSPWIVGVACMRWALVPVLHDRPASAAPLDRSFVAACIADAASLRVLGAGLGASLALGLAVGLALAAFGRAAPKRDRRAGVGAGLGGATLAAAAPVALGLAWIAGVAAVEAEAAMRLPMAALASVAHSTHGDALRRGAAAFAAADELRTFGAIPCIVAVVGLGLWSLARSAPTVGSVARAIAACGVVLLPVAVDRTAIARTITDTGRLWTTPWDGVPGFEPAAIAGGASDEPCDAAVTRNAVVLRRGEHVASASLQTDAGVSALGALFARTFRPGDAAGGVAGRGATKPMLTLAIDARVGGRTLRALVGAAQRAGARSVLFVGRDSTHPRPADLVGAAPLYAAFVGPPAAVGMLVATDAGPPGDDEQDFLHATVGSATVVHVVPRPGGTGAFDVDLARQPPASNVARPERGVWLFVSDAATTGRLLAAAVRVKARTPYVILSAEATPSALFTEPARELIRGTMIGDVYGTPAVDFIRIPPRPRRPPRSR